MILDLQRAFEGSSITSWQAEKIIWSWVALKIISEERYIVYAASQIQLLKGNITAQ